MNKYQVLESEGSNKRSKSYAKLHSSCKLGF